jgi:hypothetical protein
LRNKYTLCGKKKVPKLSIEFDHEEEQKIQSIKRKTGIKQTTELIRFLITAKSEEIQATKVVSKTQ